MRFFVFITVLNIIWHGSLNASPVLISGNDWYFVRNYSVHDQSSFASSVAVSHYNNTTDLLGSSTQGSSKVYLYNANNATNSFTNEFNFDETYSFEGITQPGAGIITMNGQYLAVSVPYHNYPTFNGQVMFYSYIAKNDSWVYLSTYTAGNGVFLGMVMSMGVDVLAAGCYSKSIYVFRVDLLQKWVLDEIITCSNIAQSLAIDGDTLAVGSDSGLVFMYNYSATKNWTLSQSIYTNTSDYVYSVSLNSSTLIVHPGNIYNFYVYKHNGTLWKHVSNITLSPALLVNATGGLNNPTLLSETLLVASVEYIVSGSKTRGVVYSFTSDHSGLVWTVQSTIALNMPHDVENNFGKKLSACYPNLVIAGQPDAYLMSYNATLTHAPTTSVSPSQAPSTQPSRGPSFSPTTTQQPSRVPSFSPTTTQQPSRVPSFALTTTPSFAPSSSPQNDLPSIQSNSDGSSSSTTLGVGAISGITVGVVVVCIAFAVACCYYYKYFYYPQHNLTAALTTPVYKASQNENCVDIEPSSSKSFSIQSPMVPVE